MGSFQDFSRSVDEFDRHMAAIQAQVPEALKNVTLGLVGKGYLHIVETSPVVKGSYRASHVIGTGDGFTLTRLIYDSPNRPTDPDAVAPEDRPLDPPSIADALAALDGETTFESFYVIGNDVYYAQTVETQHGHYVYEHARDRLESLGLISLPVVDPGATR